MAPSNSAVTKVLRDITQVDVTMDSAKMARGDVEDELWRATNDRAKIDDKYDQEWPIPHNNDDEQHKRRLPSRLAFSAAKAHAHKSHNDHEEKIARNQLKQPDMTLDMEDWHPGRDRHDHEEMRARFNP